MKQSHFSLSVSKVEKAFRSLQRFDKKLLHKKRYLKMIQRYDA